MEQVGGLIGMGQTGGSDVASLSHFWKRQNKTDFNEIKIEIKSHKVFVSKMKSFNLILG